MLVKVFHIQEKNHEECGKLKVVQGDWNMEWEVEVTQANAQLRKGLFRPDSGFFTCS